MALPAPQAFTSPAVLRASRPPCTRVSGGVSVTFAGIGVLADQLAHGDGHRVTLRCQDHLGPRPASYNNIRDGRAGAAVNKPGGVGGTTQKSVAADDVRQPAAPRSPQRTEPAEIWAHQLRKSFYLHLAGAV